MKAKCEEIAIERYLKGNISNEFKDELLWVINERSDNEQYLEILSKLLKDDSQEKLKILKTIVEMIKKQSMADNREVPLKNPKKFVNNLLEELEHELSK
jgi:DNA-binding PucR family transcriptional regulator